MPDKKSTEESRDNNTVKKMDVPSNPDHKIDQDFPGYPNSQSAEEVINPKTSDEKKTADVENKDGEKINYKKKKSDEAQSDGSGNAFEKTENAPPPPLKKGGEENY